MDDKQFDRLSRIVGRGASRRALLGVAAALTGRSVMDAQAKNHHHNRHHKHDKAGSGSPPVNYCCQFYCYNTGKTEYVCLANVTSCDCRCASAPAGCSGSFQGAQQVTSCDVCGVPPA